ncbi:MAG TPA: ATP-dependent protease ATPase subunit HslU [Candidatus Bipolaricaulota bacterium]
MDIVEINAQLPQKRPDDLSPKEIVAELDKYIIGQKQAKKAVAVALRNRIRRLRVEGELKKEIQPKNILMIGPTGVGKTEVSRRLAVLTSCPFVKVEATKFTEVGYVGRDVDTIVRDLVEASVNMVRAEEIKKIEPEARRMVRERLLDALLPAPEQQASAERQESQQRTREKLAQKLDEGTMEDRLIEIRVPQSPVRQVNVFSQEGMDQMGIDLSEMLGGLLPKRMAAKRLKIRDARDLLFNQEADKLLNHEEIQRQALQRAQDMGIVFIDEIDKIAVSGREERGGPGVSRQGVQRDLLPLLEGATVRTRYGNVSTENVLFIAAGAFSMAKPSDLIPELQGRLPIRVELQPLGREDFVRILKEPKDALTKQYHALLRTEGLSVQFTEDAVEEIAKIAHTLNESIENIGARRLQTVMEKLMEDLLFETVGAENESRTIDAPYVREKLKGVAEDLDLSRYIL